MKKVTIFIIGMLILCSGALASPPPWEFEGPGGNSSIEAKVVEIVDEDTVETMGGLHIYIYRYDNYGEPVAYFQLDSTGRFRISKFPDGVFDMIIKKRGFITTKVADIALGGRHLSRSYRPAISRVSAIRNKYVNLSVSFKNRAKDEDKNEIIKNSGIEFKYSSKIKDNSLLSTAPLEASEIPRLVDYFIQSQFVKCAYPEYNSKYADDVMAMGYKPIQDINDGTVGKGKGGDCRITIEINKYKVSRTADSFYIYVYPSNNYTTPSALMLAAPNERKFRIIELPEGDFDVILRKKGFFTGKLCNASLSLSNPNVSYAMPDLLETVDMTKYMPGEISITFKESVAETERKKIISKVGCSVKEENGDYRITIPDTVKIPAIVDYFNNLPAVSCAAPITRR